MLKINIDNVKLDNEDNKIIEAFKNTINLYKDNDFIKLWEEIKNCKFKNHVIGKGGSHIWITRKSDNERIAIITV